MKTFILIHLTNCATTTGSFDSNKIKQYHDPGLMDVECIADDDKKNKFYCLFKLKNILAKNDTFAGSNSKYSSGNYELIKSSTGQGSYLVDNSNPGEIFHFNKKMVVFQTRTLRADFDLVKLCLGTVEIDER